MMKEEAIHSGFAFPFHPPMCRLIHSDWLWWRLPAPRRSRSFPSSPSPSPLATYLARRPWIAAAPSFKNLSGCEHGSATQDLTVRVGEAVLTSPKWSRTLPRRSPERGDPPSSDGGKRERSWPGNAEGPAIAGRPASLELIRPNRRSEMNQNQILSPFPRLARDDAS